MNPSNKTENVKAMQMHDALITDLLGGTSAFRARGTYLIRNPGESDKSYRNRLQVATVFPAFKSTVFSLSSKPFKKPVMVKDTVPQAISEMMANIDLEGQNITSFACELLEAAMAYGITYALVDYPMAAGATTRADELAAGFRPYVVHIKKNSVIGITSEKVNGVQKLTEFRYMETLTANNGDFTESTISQVRVLRPGVWQTWRQDDKGNWFLFDEGFTTLDHIPVVPVYANRTGFFTGEPLLLELAHLNVKLYNSQSEQQNIVHVARVPLLTVIGAREYLDDQGNRIEASIQSLTELPEGGDMKWVELTGKSIEAGRQSDIDIKEEMAQAHAEIMQRRVARATATEVDSDDEAQLSVLQSVAMNLQDSLEQILQCFADWLQLPDGGDVEVFKDFAKHDHVTALEALKMAFEAGSISKRGLFMILQRMGFIDEEINFDDEQSMMETQGPDLADNITSILPLLSRVGA